MTTKQKCEKLAKVLETVASKLRESEIGVKVWEQNEPTMQSMVAQVHIFLKKAMEIDDSELPSTAKLRGKPKNTAGEEDRENKILNDWPDILS